MERERSIKNVKKRENKREGIKDRERKESHALHTSERRTMTWKRKLHPDPPWSDL